MATVCTTFVVIVGLTLLIDLGTALQCAYIYNYIYNRSEGCNGLENSDI